MKQKRFWFFLFLGILASLIDAQENKPLIKLNPFSIEGIGSEESRLIVSLVQSYLSDIGQLVSLAAPEPLMLPSAETPVGDLPQANLPMDSDGSTYQSAPGEAGVDYTISGTIRLERDGPVLMLEILNTKSGERYSVNAAYKSTVELTLKARSVLESAFAAGLDAEKKSAARPGTMSESTIIGAWKGDAGIEIVRLLQNGRGLAVFSSGAQMALAWRIEKNILKLWQISPNSERFYFPHPQHIAQRLAEAAEPMTWELSLYDGGAILGGIKQATGVRLRADGEAAELLPGGDVREVIWIKSNH
jgi:hypothetical protein